MSDCLYMAEIKDRVAAHYGVDVGALLSDRRSASIVWPRHVAIYLCKLHSPFSLQGIGRAFGGRDHTSVRYAIRRVEERMGRSPRLQREVETLSAAIAMRNAGVQPTPNAAEAAGRQRELLAALLQCHRRRLKRQGQALGRLEVMAGL